MSAPPIDMTEATRLTREGKLEAAMAILLRRRHPASPPAGSPPIDMIPPSAMSAGAWTAPRSWTPPPRERPEMGKFETRCFASEAGQRSYKLFVPPGRHGQALPLVVMMHGCTQSPDDFAAGTRMNELARERGFLVAWPAQSLAANPSGCWNWFNAADQRRGVGEPALIAGITRQVMADFPVEPGRVFIAGLSAGGAAAAVMGATYPDLYAAIGVHSGLACGSASDMPSALAAMNGMARGGAGRSGHLAASGAGVRAIVFHGDVDTTVKAVNGDRVIDQAKAGARLTATVSRGRSPGGIGYTRTVHADASGRAMAEQWVLHGARHAWAGGSPAGSYTDPRGPDASREMIRFFFEAR